METIFIILGILVFLGVGYVFLMILVVPYTWFESYMKSEEEKSKQSRASFIEMIEKQKETGSPERYSISQYKHEPKGLIEKFFANQVVASSLEWLFTWGLFLAIEALLAWNLYNGFELVIDKALNFLEKILGV